jgi:hypothetical protein
VPHLGVALFIRITNICTSEWVWEKSSMATRSNGIEYFILFFYRGSMFSSNIEVWNYFSNLNW